MFAGVVIGFEDRLFLVEESANEVAVTVSVLSGSLSGEAKVQLTTTAGSATGMSVLRNSLCCECSKVTVQCSECLTFECTISFLYMKIYMYIQLSITFLFRLDYNNYGWRMI